MPGWSFPQFCSKLWSKWMVPEKWSPQWGVEPRTSRSWVFSLNHLTKATCLTSFLFSSKKWNGPSKNFFRLSQQPWFSSNSFETFSFSKTSEKSRLGFFRIQQKIFKTWASDLNTGLTGQVAFYLRWPITAYNNVFKFFFCFSLKLKWKVWITFLKCIHAE